MKRTAGEHMNDSVSIYKLGIYGKAYDVPGTRRAYTYKHQPDNQGAWRLGEARIMASLTCGGDYIDAGLGLLKQLELKGYGVYELEEAGAPEERPDLIRFDFINDDGQQDSKMITHDEMRERYSSLYQQSESSLEREQIALAHADAVGGLHAEIERLRAALRSCAKASSAAGVGVIIDDALRDARAFTLEHDGGRAGVVRGRIDAALAEPCRLNMPELDEHLRYILGRPNFWCYHLANALRAMGQEIARKAEEEQAAVIHFLLKAYFEHGPGWREAVEKILAAEREKELAKGGDK